MKSFKIRGHLAGLAVVTAALIAAPTAAAATIAPTSHNFGNVNVSASSAQTFTVTNGCQVVNPIGGGCLIPEFTFMDLPAPPSVTPTSDYSLVENCPAVLATSGATCGLDVTFKPSALGVRNGTLTAGPFSVPLTGTGVTPAAPTVPTAQTPAAGGVAGKAKKCKKKKRGAAAAKKKCKKKK